MSEAQALAILSLQFPPADQEELADLVSELVFPIREFFLRQPIIAVLFQSRVQRLEKISAAASVLGLSFSASPEVYTLRAFQLSDPLEFLLSAYEEQLSDLRLLIASTFDPLLISALAKKMIDLQQNFEEHFLELTIEAAAFEGDVKAADAIDTGRVLFRIKHEGEEAVSDAIARERKRILQLRDRNS